MHKYLIFIFPFLLFLTSCLSTENSNKSSGEFIELKTKYFEKPLNYADFMPENNSESRGLITLDLLLSGVDFAFDGLKKIITKNNSKYSQTFHQIKSNNKFYGNTSTISPLDPSNLHFKSFSLNRYIKNKNANLKAFSATFSIDTSKWKDIYTQSKFYLTCDSLELHYSKCKLNKKNWFFPWTLFQKNQQAMRLDVEIEILSNFIDFNGVISRNVPIGKFHVSFDEFEPNKSIKRNIPLDGFAYLPPRSAAHSINARGRLQKAYGLGDVTIIAKVTESSKNYKINNILYDNSSLIEKFDHSEIKKEIKNKLQKSSN